MTDQEKAAVAKLLKQYCYELEVKASEQEAKGNPSLAKWQRSDAAIALAIAGKIEAPECDKAEWDASVNAALAMQHK